MDYTRREFLNTITSATLTAAGLSALPGLSSDKTQPNQEFDGIPQNGTVLFQGDSITDFGRNRDEKKPNSGLGHGYPFIAAARLRNLVASRSVQCYNRGISGNKVFQLSDRWETDALQLQPNLLSILIGVNDFWHTIDFDYDGTIETYRNDFIALMERTKKALPEVKIVIGEPYVVEEGSAITDEWFPTFPKYRQAAKEIAQKFDTAFVPYQSVFDEAAKRATPTYWTEDGVHPTLAGSDLMAHAWLETVKRM